jgi:hypothetical protein
MSLLFSFGFSWLVLGAPVAFIVMLFMCIFFPKLAQLYIWLFVFPFFTGALAVGLHFLLGVVHEVFDVFSWFAWSSGVFKGCLLVVCPFTFMWMVNTSKGAAEWSQ